ncbi:MAG TPA: cytochrome c biogenesis protein CcdA [Nitrospirota bacterium]|nr:cytochrome c biogenesis protein CcdA [Nitrospirota bacterium]
MDISHGLTLSVLLFSLFMGLISFASPCILPLIPSYVSYITGISYDDLLSKESRRKNMNITFLHSVAFVSGFTIIFVLLGATASFAGSVLSRHLDLIRIVGGVLIIIMGVFVMDVVNIPFLQREAKLQLKTRPAGYAGTLVVGMIFGAGWTPCTGPFLGSVLALAMETDTLGRGMALLTFYSFGLGIPFILSAIAISAFLSSFNKLRTYFKVIKIASGAILVIMGVLLITDKMTILIPR